MEEASLKSSTVFPLVTFSRMNIDFMILLSLKILATKQVRIFHRFCWDFRTTVAWQMLDGRQVVTKEH